MTVKINQRQRLEQVHYCAPELLERIPYQKYDRDYKCEVYSFGILLWKIAEEKIPYQGKDEILDIVILVRNGYREPFSENSPIPEKYKKLEVDGVYNKNI